MTRVLFVEGRDEALLRGFASRLGTGWRLLARPEQGLFLLEATDAGEALELEAASLASARAWAFDVVDEGPRG